MAGFRSLVICLIIMVASVCSAMAAQSSKDVTVTDAQKSQAKSKVLEGSGVVQPQDPEYVIGHGDLLDVQVYGEGSMAVTAPQAAADGSAADANVPAGAIQVRIDGRISLKHIGDVEVVGMNMTQAADYLKMLYSSVYDDPVVTVVLKKSNSKLYTVMGKVVNPGVFNIEQPINLVQVIARCGGFTEWANSELTVVRENGSKSSPYFDGNTLKFDYDDFLAGRNLEKNIIIKSGDIIIVH